MFYNKMLEFIRLMSPSFLIKILLHNHTGIISKYLRWSLSDPMTSGPDNDQHRYLVMRPV
jgi:hypothetical protein